MRRFIIRPRLAGVLLFFVSGIVQLYAASGALAPAGATGSRVSIELSGRPSVEMTTFRRAGHYTFIISFKGSLLLGGPRHLTDSAGGVTTVAVSQYTRSPDVVRAVVRSDHRIGLPFETAHEAGDRYRISMAIIPPSHFKVFLDVGHGGYDPGGTGPDGLPESMVNLSVAKHMAALLRNEGISVELDRSDNTFVSLAGRVALADRSGANLFLGLYCNASADRAIHGTTTYYYHANSYDFARYLEDRVAANLGLSNDGVMKDNLYVIRHTTTRIPDVLIEYAYISNYREEHLLASASFRRRVATSLANAVVGYFLAKGTGGSQSAPNGGPAIGRGMPARIVAVSQPDATVAIESIGRPSIDSFTLKSGGRIYFVVNLKNATLAGGQRRFGVGPPFSGEVTVDQYSVSPRVVRVAVKEAYQNSYQIYTQRGSGGRYVTTIYPVAN